MSSGKENQISIYPIFYLLEGDYVHPSLALCLSLSLSIHLRRACTPNIYSLIFVPKPTALRPFTHSFVAQIPRPRTPETYTLDPKTPELQKVAEIKRAVFRALTRLRAATIKAALFWVIRKPKPLNALYKSLVCGFFRYWSLQGFG